MTVEDVRVALADACASISGWRASPYIRDTVAPPEIQVARGVTNFDIVMGRGADDFQYRLIAYVQRDSERSGQILLDELCEPSGPGSLKEVLETVEVATAAGADYIRVREASEVRSVEVGLVAYMLVEFTVEVCY